MEGLYMASSLACALNLCVKQSNFHLSSLHSLAWPNSWTFHLWTNVQLKRSSVQHDHYCVVSETYHKGAFFP